MPCFSGWPAIISQSFASRRGHERRFSFHAIKFGRRAPGRSSLFFCSVYIWSSTTFADPGVVSRQRWRATPDGVDITLSRHCSRKKKGEGREATNTTTTILVSSTPHIYPVAAWQFFDMQPCRPGGFMCSPHVGNTDPMLHHLGLHCEPDQRRRGGRVAQG
jgi:hypothetical protein